MLAHEWRDTDVVWTPVSARASARSGSHHTYTPRPIQACLQRAQRLVHVAPDGEVVDRDVLQNALQQRVAAGRGVPGGLACLRALQLLHTCQSHHSHSHSHSHILVAMDGHPAIPLLPPPQLPRWHLRVDDVEAAQRDAGVPLQRAVPRRHRLGDVRQDRDLQQQQG